MRIARLGPDDAEALRAVRLEALATHPENFGADHDAEVVHPLAWWRARLDNPGGAGFGAWIGDDLAGIISFGVETGEKHRHQGSIGSFYVRAAHRGQGVGDALMRAALEEAANRVEQIALTVTASNAGAIRLYERHGFATIGKKPRSIRIGEVYHDELEMWRRV
jgi:ribosomal protein S18 acetylase RimI-like enzyme